MKSYLEKVLGKLDGLESDIEVIQSNVQRDHVHMVAMIPPRVSVASVVQYIKSQTGKRLRYRFSHVRRAITRGGGIWSRGYFVSTVGVDERTIRDYVEHQEHEDNGRLQLELGLR